MSEKRRQIWRRHLYDAERLSCGDCSIMPRAYWLLVLVCLHVEPVPPPERDPSPLPTADPPIIIVPGYPSGPVALVFDLRTS